ncbi:EAL domain-containing protein [Priestia flexa]|nr:EAL domain-containing protein [Priestia flexa]
MWVSNRYRRCRNRDGESSARCGASVPDIIKLDRYFSRGLADSKEKQEMVKCLSQYNEGNTTLILEGIECEKDLAIALALDIKVVQGYLLDRPAAIDTFLKTHQLRQSLSFGGIH